MMIGNFKQASSEAKGVSQIVLKGFPLKVTSVWSLTCRKGMAALVIKPVFDAEV